MYVLVLSWWKVLVLVIKYIQSTPARLWGIPGSSADPNI